MNAISPPPLFPPGLPLMHGPHMTAELTRWAVKRFPRPPAAGGVADYAVGVVREGGLAAVIVYTDFDVARQTVQMSCAADTPRWATRQVIAAALAVAFNGRLGAPVRKVWALTSSDNPRARKMMIRIGFKPEAVLRHQEAPGVHTEFFGMLEREFRRKYEVVR